MKAIRITAQAVMDALQHLERLTGRRRMTSKQRQQNMAAIEHRERKHV